MTPSPRSTRVDESGFACATGKLNFWQRNHWARTYLKPLVDLLQSWGFTRWSCLKLMVWSVGFYYFVEWEFGVVYFLFSAFYFIYANMGNESEEHKHDRVSAYSVFNKGGQEVLGNFNTSGLEQSFGLPKY